jgi:ribosomal protein S18 acetylase RimI-like enzyme
LRLYGRFSEQLIEDAVTETSGRDGCPTAVDKRPVVRDDLPALKIVIDGSGLFSSELLEGMISGFLAGDAGDGFWLTADDGGPQAIAYCEPERMTQGTWNLLLIAVNPGRRSQGIGAALVDHVEATLAERGERVLLVETSGSPSFQRTRSFYLANGYAEEARIRDYYEAGEDKVIFWKSLNRVP